MRGTVTTGAGDAAEFVPLISDIVVEELGFRPYPGTLNLAHTTGIEELPTIEVIHESFETDNCRGVKFSPCSVNGVRSAVVEPLMEEYPPDKSELLAPVNMRRTFDIEDGDTVNISKPFAQMGTTDDDIDVRGLTEFDGVVFDVNGLLDKLAGGLTKSDTSDAADSTVVTLRSIIRRIADFECNIGVYAVADLTTAKQVLDEIGLGEDVTTIVDTDTRLRSEMLRKYVRSIDTAPGNIVLVGIDSIDGSIARDVEASYLDLTQIQVPG